MEQPIQNGQFVVMTKGNWKMKTVTPTYTIRDDDVKGTIDIHVGKVSNQSFISIDKFTIEAFPSNSGGSMQSIHVPDYLGAGLKRLKDIRVRSDHFFEVTGNKFCIVYQPEKDRRIFAVYDIDEANKKVVATGQCQITKDPQPVADLPVVAEEKPEEKQEDSKNKDKKEKSKGKKEKKTKKDKKEDKSKKSDKKNKKLVPTAIMAIKDKVFVGFPGFVGFVDLTQPSLSLNLFHEWKEQKWGDRDLKTIDAFAYDSTMPKGELVAIDDVVWPKYAFAYNISEPMPQVVGRFDLPSGSNSHYMDAVKHGNTLVLTARSTTSGGYTNKIVVLEGTKAIWTISESRSPGGQGKLFAGNEWTVPSSVGILNKNVIVITAGKRGVIAMPIDQIKKVKEEMYGREYEVPKPHGVKNLVIGVSSEELVTVKEKSTAFVLSTSEDTNSVLSEVKWNEQTKDLEVVCTHKLQGLYDRLFMEV